MELNFIEVSQFILAVVTLATGYFGWKATSEKNKLKAEVDGMKANNEAQEIKNQNSWLDLYKKLHDDQASRLHKAELEIQGLKKALTRFEDAFKKYTICPHAPCPIQLELSKLKTRDDKRSKGKRTGSRQREPTSDEDDQADNDPAGDG
ncbi:hypothetical protein M2451_003321 [Dysgonomonas sp. PFB1-18]|uniref:hypothetical protein n=1 Tax=unclassified Dysgonomonas TaxID=2630389 RepID=UPI00247712FC|nr:MULTISPECIES: hypothetical protein [unclassified Dysgonomonas]MDH6310589.1 hypothetical protein [Dysgonomonas sp. PF1-14]MDH6340439.1 hypothetical protein [Dysgonomonas sp. PF1-16]MDH6381981.1 hypothetical protein [Dysgonomonas sp. PFB1-18]MDH6399410.1 hypothetical protein [Dysgonomonas sp. PF1-23]